jgi:hypothetical protein
MVIPVDIDKLRMPRQVECYGVMSRIRLPRHVRGERFLRGPIPLFWLSVAARLPGHALHVALQLWHWAGIKGSAQINLSMADMEKQLGVSRFSGARGLKALEQAGLISVIRHRGRHPVVTILNPKAMPSISAQARLLPISQAKSTT